MKTTSHSNVPHALEPPKRLESLSSSFAAHACMPLQTDSLYWPLIFSEHWMEIAKTDKPSHVGTRFPFLESRARDHHFGNPAFSIQALDGKELISQREVRTYHPYEEQHGDKTIATVPRASD